MILESSQIVWSEKSMHAITVERIKHIMEVLSKSMSEFKPEMEMHDFGFVQDTYLLLSELLTVRSSMTSDAFQNSENAGNSGKYKEDLIKEGNPEKLLKDIYEILKRNDYRMHMDTKEKHHCVIVLRAIYEILMVMYEKQRDEKLQD